MRVQSDKLEYSKMMQDICLHTENLEVIEDVVEEVICENNKFKAVRLQEKGIIEAKACILTTGTYMDSTVMISSDTRSEGPDGDKTTKNLSESLRKLGIKLFRLKTGTPQRVLTSSIDFSKTKYEPGSKEFLHFSSITKKEDVLDYDKQVPCYLTYTTDETLKIIKENLNKSSMYSGVVKGVGPRYCPSIEDAISSGKALNKLAEFVSSQGGDPSYVFNPSKLCKAEQVVNVFSEKEGYISGIVCDEVGICSMILGGGRETKESEIDLSVGIVLKKKVGDYVKKGDILAEIHSNNAEKTKEAMSRLLKTYSFTEASVEKTDIIKMII